MKATINYVIPPQDGVVRFVLDNHWSGLNLDPRTVPISDARKLPAPTTLDREGFTLTRVVSGVTDYRDEQQLKSLWMPAVCETIKSLTGASWVATFAHNVRFSNNSANATKTSVSAPARAIHADLSPAFDLARLGDEPLAGEAALAMKNRWGNQLPRRWRVYNIWQQISPPPQDTPLALCDLTSIDPGDILDSAGRDTLGSDKVYALTFFRHNPGHRWFYFSNMLPGEAIVFSGYDPQAPDNSRVAHTAFDLPRSPVHAVPRNSIEIRAVAAFDDA